MNLDELRSVQSKERQKDSLQNLRPSFYQEVGEYIADLEDERDRVAERAEDPFSSPEVGRLTDEIETAKDVVEAIYERRMGKLVKQASLAAAGMAADDEGLTAEEAALFDDLVDRIGANKSRVLDVLEGTEEPAVAPDAATDSASGSDPAGAAPPHDGESRSETQSPRDATADDVPPAPPEEPPTDVGAAAADGPKADEASGVSPADVMGGTGRSIDQADASGGDRTDAAGEPTGQAERPSEHARDDRPADPDETPPPSDPEAAPSGTAGSSPTDDTADSSPTDAAVDRTTVRITSDIGAILGVDDREYTLTTDDVVTLPEQNAAPLVDREAAERLE
ncbi:hypothetical protein [Natrinema longum]|uniref:DNA replication factor GINS n=1 Tax=Natrinema longum TaxID=370324 RepID=A0A8A2U746_9EURY|nr:hypothetical protein [Natrinema longum]MBZ6494016.1 hypothetical protein [Natrinema longum]QSW84649.1 hypothetical protein J0X27_14510 [Natrinema longum]